jgi:translation initiation factor 2B subunit (eIF-2B alpha/beta/delta family)
MFSLQLHIQFTECLVTLNQGMRFEVVIDAAVVASLWGCDVVFVGVKLRIVEGL